MKPKKIDRSTKKWRELVKKKVMELTIELSKGNIRATTSDIITEAEEYADRLYSAMR